MKKTWKDNLGDFLAGKGFYIVLCLCIVAMGISGYYLFDSVREDGSMMAVSQTQVTVAATPTPTATISPTPPAVPSATATPSATVTPTNTPTPIPSTAPVEEPAVAPTTVPTSSIFTWPVRGTVLTDFSMETLAYDQTMGDWRTHSGIDIESTLGTQVLAAAGGTVVALNQDDLMGTTVVIDHGNSITSSYANLAAVPTVAVGDTVSTGDIIGAVGKTAIAESALAPHLHFEMTKDGLAVNPLDYLPDLT